MYLITYKCDNKYSNKSSTGHSFTSNPEEWLGGVQDYQDETYFIINVLEVSEDFYNYYNGRLKGL